MPEDRRHTSSVRKLAAIMFTDIVGYTALMGEDEDLAFQLLKKNRSLQKPIIEKYGGTWLKEIGDAILASFPTDSDAVYCAKEIQEVCKEEPDLQLRIGIHEGEVVFEEGDVYGDGVNIASRLQSIAPAEGIYISENVNRNIENKKGIDTRFVKQETLKNVKRPVRIYEIDNEGSASKKTRFGNRKLIIYAIGTAFVAILAFVIWNSFREYSSDAIAQRVISQSIAVLPFENMSGDETQEFMCDGLTEEVIHHLSRIGAYEKVISRTSVMKYKKTNLSIPEIATELGVETVLEGSYRQSGERIRISATLINGITDNLIWSGEYERPLGDIIDIQSDIALNITRSLRAEITKAELDRIEKIPTRNIDAYNLLQQAKLEFRWDDYQNSLENARKAVELDPNFAEANAFLAQCYLATGTWWGEDPIEEALTKAKPHIQFSLEFDPELALGHLVQGLVYFWYEGDYISAEKEFLTALSFEPNNSLIIDRYRNFLTKMNRHEEALVFANKEYALSPASGYWGILDLARLGKQDRALELIHESPKYSTIQFIQLGLFDSARSHFDKWIISENGSQNPKSLINRPLYQSRQALAYFKTDEPEKASNIITDLSQQSLKSGLIDPYFIGWYYSGIGELDSAFLWLEKAYDFSSPEITWLKADQVFDILREDDRYWILYNKTGHFAYDQYLDQVLSKANND